MKIRSRMRALGGALAVVLAAAMLPTVASAGPSDKGCEKRNLKDIEQLLECVNGDDVYTHLEAFQAIADANDDNRASGTSGYDESADYVAGLLEDAGLTVERQVFSFITYQEVSSSLTIDGESIDTDSFSYSGSGSVTDGNVIAVDLDLGLGNTSSSGCEASDFDGLDFSGDNDIALMQRGTCAFGDKAANAQAAGAEGAIIFNQGNADGRFGLVGGTLGERDDITIPVVDATYETGEMLATGEHTVSLSVEAISETKDTENVIADLEGRNTDNVVMAGAHLDSVPEGPGINDNGTGSAAILSVALQLANNEKFTPQNTLRFAWWGAEESGLVGSDKYVFDPEFGLTQEEYDAIALYINFDMVGSPNFIYGVYDADQSTFEATANVPAGSAELEDLFEAYYSYNDIPYEDSEFSGRSDYQAFIDVGIPASGLFTGAEVVKTEEQEAIWGGIAGESFDQCYHQACDTIDNVSAEAVEVNVDAIGYAIFSLAASTEAVNGVEGIDISGPTVDTVELDGPQGTFAEGGGGLSPDHDHDHGDRD
ncbi:M20/M25/M40 family metallo-hydrolase [Salsipaludibacter albus]|uniref:M20/M25/M40 family metallo-hydrolase n=1 Tax=Salsipaludibacter albus TaxID=2849650 RepID=UPI001EE452F0|nr:M20/M25/M40 family metallo-hydrolase [Salsipaludibacter albus]MBY5161524.1 M20/M25/M40 family metallo-hydrolase [Salsipaludibacter albus]